MVRQRIVQLGRNNLTIVVKKVKGKLYVYDEFRLNGQVVTNYIGPLEEMTHIYQVYKSLGKVEKLSKRDLRRLAKMIVEEIAKKITVVNSQAKHSKKYKGQAGPRGFEPRVSGLEGRRPILARLRAHCSTPAFILGNIFRGI